jgi:hypothetical protein
MPSDELRCCLKRLTRTVIRSNIGSLRWLDLELCALALELCAKATVLRGGRAAAASPP